jgi:uncharacterized protein DUF6205
MGYVTRFTGEIVIVPPIPWGKIQNSPFLPDSAKARDGRDLKFRIQEEAVDTDEGRLYRRSAVALVSTWDDDARGYDIVEHLQEAVDAFPAHEFSGRLDCEGEETGDLWRLEVHDRRAVKVRPRIVWPNGDTVDFRD